ncbi:MAG: pyruvate dehydrogenase (acetyl-transferring) E1 component subunit alpha [Spirochaetales bacterium]|nr:MAG: pyruvate dehydrogenase (acetyl-transferring) E1 component subunit alpha [Spirochaetales bacterium]
MLLQDAELLRDETYQCLDDEGVPVDPAWESPLTGETVTEAYRRMLYARTADLMAVSYQRQGRMFTYPPNLGQEAAAVAAGMVIRKEDWLVPAFRELGTWLARGVTMKEIFLFYRGNEDGSRFVNAPNTLPITVPIASQLPHAVGLGFALNYREKKAAVFAFTGDGGTSEGDFHEALNFAAVWKVPVVFIIQNNQFAISVPVRKQTASVNLAVKALAYGMKGCKADGNDFFAMHSALSAARDYAIGGGGPVLIEAVTFRKGAHTTYDDPRLYRTKELEDFWEKKDPLARLAKYLVSKGLWNKKTEEALLKDYRQDIDRQFSEAESWGPYRLEDVFSHMYADMPAELKTQKRDYEKFLAWKESGL